MNLLGKFTLALLLCGLAPLLLGTLLTHTITKRALNHTEQQAKDALEQKAKEHVTSLVRAEGEHLETFIRGIANETQILSRTGRLGYLLESGAFYRFAEEIGPSFDPAAAREELMRRYAPHRPNGARARGNPSRPALPGGLEAHINALSDNALAVQQYHVSPGPGSPRPPRESELPTQYGDTHRQLDYFWPAAMSHLGYRDMLLVDGERGDIVYSVNRGIDFGASLVEGPLADSAAARAYRQVWEEDDGRLVFEDVAPYYPIRDEPVCFVGAPVLMQGRKVGVALFVLTLDRFDAVLNTSAPLEGNSAMYLVGPDYRPRSRLDLLRATQAEGETSEAGVAIDIEPGRAVLRRSGRPHRPHEDDGTRLDTEPARTVFHLGTMGNGIYKGPSGEEAFVAYAPVDVLGVTWALIAQVDTKTAFAAVGKMQESSAFYINRMLYLGDFIVIAAILILCFVADYLAKPIVRPLRSTVAILKGMVEGEDALNQRLVVRGKDEVAELASAFNRFMDKLQLLYESLEKEVTDRRAAQEEVERSQQYYKALIEYAPDVIVVFDMERRPLFVSPAFQRTFGYSADEVIGRNLSEIIHPDDLEGLAKTAAEGEKNPGVPTHSEYRMRHKDGHWVDVSSIGTNYAEDSSIAGVVVNLRDITRRKEADRILREYSATLERDVAERTIELKQNRDELAHTLEQLRSTQDKLVLNEKMASLGALTAGIAHEIKNPLNFVTNFAELTAELAEEIAEEMEPVRDLMDDTLKANLDELLEDLQQNSRKIEEHGKRADSIVKSMLLHSRGKKDARQATDINALLEEYVQLSYHGMRAQDSTFNIELDVQLAADIPAMEVVPQDLARVFLNILNNGCYATQQRKLSAPEDFQPKLTVRTERSGENVVVRIRDNGMGMSQETIDKIFTPFFTTKPAGAGTGLGLSISYDIVVQEHHGELRVESEPGEYTEFQIILPVGTAKQETGP